MEKEIIINGVRVDFSNIIKKKNELLNRYYNLKFLVNTNNDLSQQLHNGMNDYIGVGDNRFNNIEKGVFKSTIQIFTERIIDNLDIPSTWVVCEDDILDLLERSLRQNLFEKMEKLYPKMSILNGGFFDDYLMDDAEKPMSDFIWDVMDKLEMTHPSSHKITNYFENDYDDTCEDFYWLHIYNLICWSIRGYDFNKFLADNYDEFKTDKDYELKAKMNVTIGNTNADVEIHFTEKAKDMSELNHKIYNILNGKFDVAIDRIEPIS